MLTTHQLIQTSTSYFFPTLLLLIFWYSAASAMRSVFDLIVRLVRKRGVKQIKDTKERTVVKEKKIPIKSNTDTTPDAKPKLSDVDQQVLTLERELRDLKRKLAKHMLEGRKATPARLFLISAEGALFISLAIMSYIWAEPIVKTIPTSLLWIHIVGIIFFLCFIVKLRRVLLLVPLTLMAFLSWEVFSFITTFEKTLEATSTLARIKVLQLYPPQNAKELPQVKVMLKYRGQHQRTLTIPARQKIYIEGRFFRISSEVLLFGGRNIATMDRVFSDIMASANGTLLLSKESVPPQYQLQQAKSGFPHLLPRQKMFYWLWKQFFQLKNQQNSSQQQYIKMVPLASVACTPLIPGKEFEIRLRHVGGLECYIVKDKSKSEPVPTTQPLMKVNKPG